MNKILAVWASIPPKTKQWLKGAEAAFVTAVVAAFIAAPATDLHTTRGIAEFVAGIGSAGYAALRLYMTQNPLPVTVQEKTSTQTLSVGDLSKTTSTTEVTTSGPAAQTVGVAVKPQSEYTEADVTGIDPPTFLSGITTVPNSFKPSTVKAIHPDLTPTAVSNPRITKLR